MAALGVAARLGAAVPVARLARQDAAVRRDWRVRRPEAAAAALWPGRAAPAVREQRRDAAVPAARREQRAPLDAAARAAQPERRAPLEQRARRVRQEQRARLEQPARREQPARQGQRAPAARLVQPMLVPPTPTPMAGQMAAPTGRPAPTPARWERIGVAVAAARRLA
jgi:hypothetical protein